MGGAAIFVRRPQECMELCVRSHGLPAESLWFRITGKTSMRDNVPSVCCGSHKEEVAETLFRHCKKPHVHRHWCSQVTLAHLYLLEDMSMSNPEDFWNALMTASWHRQFRRQ